MFDVFSVCRVGSFKDKKKKLHDKVCPKPLTDVYIL